jgi:hypothetical protein
MLTAPVRLFTLETPDPDVLKPQLGLFCRQTVPPSFGRLIVLLEVGVVKPSVVVNDPLRPVMTLLLLPLSVKSWLMAPIVKAAPGVIFNEAVLTRAEVVTLPFTVRGKPISTIEPLSLMLLSPITVPAVNFAIALTVPFGLALTLAPPTPPGQA